MMAKVVKDIGYVSVESIGTYRKRKIKIMERDFCIKLTQAEIDHIYEPPTAGAIDAYCIDIINDRWG
jgi:hypothetical protein